jgi:CxxC motif-containing protein (DUF1111 family)
MIEEGGPIVQAKGIRTESCSTTGEGVPRDATLTRRRQVQALYGAGLIEAIREADILRHADPDDRDHDGISGRPNRIAPSSDGGAARIGRFGWKAQVPTLREFAGEALVEEIGITNPLFPDEQKPQGKPVSCDAVPDPEDDGGRLGALTDFLTMLAPLPPGPRSAQVRRGRLVFRRSGCASCHVESLRTGASPVAALRHQRVKLFSDLLLHDMGPALADGIEQGEASGAEFRTAPLWGLAHRGPYLHDGRATTPAEAIVAHGGEAQVARERYLALGQADREALAAFLGAL